MPSLGEGRLGCYRCGHVWRPNVGRDPKVCPLCKSKLWDTPLLQRIRQGKGLGVDEVVRPHRDAILRAAEKHGFGHVRVFGSVRRSEATSASDVDLLVARIRHPSLLARSALMIELEEILGRKVDVVTDESLHWKLRPQIQFEAVGV